MNNKLTMIKLAIADDEAIFVDLLEQFLGSQPDIQCLFTAYSGESFLEKLKEADELPNLVLLDLKMKELSGEDVVAKIREEYSGIRSIVMSSHYKKAFVGYMLRVGVNAFIPKGVSPDKLLDVMQSVHQKGYYLMEEQLEAIREQISSQSPRPKINPDAEITEREVEVLKLICKQYTAAEIADKLFISKRTVDGHKSNLFMKTGARNIAGLVIYAIQNHMISAEELEVL